MSPIKIHETSDYQYLYSTVRIEGFTIQNTHISGTGFYYNFQEKDGLSLIGIVTNKHILKDVKEALIKIIITDNNGDPDDRFPISITITNPTSLAIAHPDENIDLCAILLHTILDVEKDIPAGRKLCFYPFSELDFLTEEDFIELSAVEDIIMIGYPNGLMDEFNNKPIIRKGITATHIKYNYDDNPEFLIDMFCFPGSSGSPILLYKFGLHKIGEQDHFLGPKTKLVGLLSHSYEATLEGKLELRELNRLKLKPILDVEINLGLVIKIEKLLDISKIVIAKSGKESN